MSEAWLLVQVVAASALSRSFAEGAAPPQATAAPLPVAAAGTSDADAKAAARAAKLKAMQDRLNAWQQQSSTGTGDE